MATQIALGIRRALLSLIAALGCAGFLSFGCSTGTPGASRTSPSHLTQSDQADAGHCDQAEAGYDAANADLQSEPDKVVCGVDADCDRDKVCKLGLCTGTDHPCTMNAECKTGEVCRSGNCEDPN
jgi:hypothetical protein